MHVPAALELWAAEHNDQLSEDTIDEVRAIAAALANTELASASIGAPTAGNLDQIDDVFPPDRAERARALLPVVAAWVERHQQTPPVTQPEPEPQSEELPAEQHGMGIGPDDTPHLEAARAATATADLPDADLPDADLPQAANAEADLPEVATTGATTTEATRIEPEQDHRGPRFVNASAPDPVFAELAADDDPLAAPAFLRSDRVDEEDDARIYGPRRPWSAIFGTLLLLGLLIAGGVFGWMWFQRANDESTTADTSTEPAPTSSATSESATADAVTPSAEEPTAAEPAPSVTAEPSPTEPAEPQVVVESYWADIMPILNSGSSSILSSTYVVSPSNRAVLTGHTAGITGIAISDDGRVLTSGADRRLVDWGADVTIANPDVLNVPSALTVLERTVDQRIIAGDLDGNITIIDLVTEGEPVTIAVHDVAVSALTELSDGRLAVASVDGDVAVFAIDTPDDSLDFPHDNEVTAVVGMPDGSVATASVDGAVRIWPSDGSAFSQVDTLGSPATALALLADGRLAVASVTGDIQVFSSNGADLVQLPGHVGAVRAVLEVDSPDGSRVLVSGGDDTTVRIWDIEGQAQVRVLEGHGDIISGLDQLPDGRIVSTSGDGTGRVWDLTVAPNAPVIAPHSWNLSAMHAWDNDQFVTGGVDGQVMLASTAETTRPQLITQHDAPIVGLGVLQSGDVVSLDASSVLRVNEPSGDQAGLVELSVAPGATALAIRDAVGIATGHTDGTVRLHDFVEETAVVDAHVGGVNDIIVLSSGLLVSAGQDNEVRVIDPDNLDAVVTFGLHTTPVDVVVELADGRIASASSDGIYLWSIDGLVDGHVRLNGQRGRTLSLIALAGDRLVSTGDDGRVRLWDLASPEAEPETLIDIPGVINPYLIQADNGLFVAGAARGYVVFTLN